MNSDCGKYLLVQVITVCMWVISGCSTELTEPKYNDGDADLSKFIAIGGSYTAGYSDNALHLQHQTFSYPSILAGSFARTSGGTFRQPLVNPGVGLGLDGNSRSRYELVNSACDNPYINTTFVDSTGDQSNTAWIGAAIRYQNMGVPGARITDLNKQQFGDPSPFIGNVFYSRFAVNPGQSTVIGDALIQSPTFFTVSIGLDDVLGYALSGGGSSQDSITPVLVFENELTDLISSLTSLDADGLLTTIPDLSSLPFFSAIPYNGLVLSAGEAQNLNQLYAQVNPSIQFQEGNNAFVISDTSDPSGFRQILPGEFILLSNPLDSIKCAGLGSTNPFKASGVITKPEADLIAVAISGYNTAISDVASQYGLGLADLNTAFKKLETGYLFSGVTYTNNYVLSSLFSSDGIHPNPKGSAFIANEIIRTINNHYGARLPLVDIHDYPGNILP
jgi:hypothetical protein